jgi:hypothetical protein
MKAYPNFINVLQQCPLLDICFLGRVYSNDSTCFALDLLSEWIELARGVQAVCAQAARHWTGLALAMNAVDVNPGIASG